MSTTIARLTSPVRSEPRPKPAAPASVHAVARDALSNGRGTALRAAAEKRLGSSPFGSPVGSSSASVGARVNSLGTLTLQGKAYGPTQIGIDSCAGPSRSQAIADAHALFVGSSGVPGTLEGSVVTDYKDVTDSTFAKDASAQLEQNRPLEAQALTQLSAADAQRYQDVQAKLASDPTAQLAMQTMLLEGRLPGANDLRDGKNLLEQLDGLSKQPLAPGLADSDKLLAQTVKEVFIPQSIAQGYRNTCGATASVISLAEANPAEYVRLVAGLASVDGTVQLANGDTIARESNTLAADDSSRSVSQRLLEPALMEYANGIFDYNNATDKTFFVVPGLLTGWIQHLQAGLFGKPFTSQEGNGATLAPKVEEALKAGQTPVLVGMEWPEAGKGHCLKVESIEQVGDQKFVVLTNPWGQTERIPYEEFQKHLIGIIEPA